MNKIHPIDNPFLITVGDAYRDRDGSCSQSTTFITTGFRGMAKLLDVSNRSVTSTSIPIHTDQIPVSVGSIQGLQRHDSVGHFVPWIFP